MTSRIAVWVPLCALLLAAGLMIPSLAWAMDCRSAALDESYNQERECWDHSSVDFCETMQPIFFANLKLECMGEWMECAEEDVLTVEERCSKIYWKGHRITGP